MSYRKYGSRMSQRYLNQNLIVSLTEDFFENRAPVFQQYISESHTSNSNVSISFAFINHLHHFLRAWDKSLRCTLIYTSHSLHQQ